MDFQLTSDELNERIAALDGRDDLPYEAFRDKAVPYIGWFWRHVDFDQDDYSFGLMPDRLGGALVGFMENNKWEYNYTNCPPDDWQEIRQLLEAAVLDQTRDNLKAANDKIQSLIAGKRILTTTIVYAY